MNIGTEDDIAADIRKALEPEPEAIAPAAPEPVEEPQEESEQQETRARGADGKFVAKEAETAQDITDQPSEEVAEPPSQAVTRPPSSWSPAAKAEFDKLPPAVQQAVAKREQEIDQGLRRKAEEVKRYQPLEDLIAPRRSKWNLAGMDDASALRTLFAAQDVLETNAVQGIQHLMRAYGVTAAQLTGQPSEAQPVGQPTQDNALLQRIAQLEQSLQNREQETYQSQVEAFQNDPANLYFENVRSEMAVLLQSGKAKDLKEAYEMACWMRPDIRSLLQVPQVSKQADVEKVERAKRAGASVTGSPAETGSAYKSNGSIEDDIRAAMAEANGR